MGTLFVVATPIGNLEDITIRALNTLRDVDLIACEDTRHTRILLNKYELKTPTISYHQHSKITKINEIVEMLKSGKNIAIVTDAGTPGINDPGGILVENAIENSINVIPIPGSSALTTLLSVSGIKSDRFLFLGFLPQKKGRQTLMRNLMKISNMDLYDAIVLYESPYRILRTLEDMQLFVGNRYAVVGRELTKKFEEVIRGNISQVIQHFKNKNNEDSKEKSSLIRGEFVVCIKSK